MNFISVNEPDKFVFHDGFIEKIRFSGSDMLWNVSDICVEKNNSQNSGEFAMGIDVAEVVFKNYNIRSAMIDNKEMTQEQWEEIITYCGEAHPYFTGMTGNAFDDSVSIDVEYVFENWFVQMKFFCTEFIVRWDKFNGRAWYDIEGKDSLLKRAVKKLSKKTRNNI
ncbi:MAG: hypothetical protein ACI4KG_05030 [Oscillospiraceae bacterium]